MHPRPVHSWKVAALAAHHSRVTGYKRIVYSEDPILARATTKYSVQRHSL